ncbi:MAG: TIGR02757 family protein [Phycisphaeraceae bacterium]|nr:TIGR02757 family protein [Phycisphaeraceae bacterium]
MKAQLEQMTDALDRLYMTYNRFDRIAPDPLQFVYQYASGEDREIVGFLSAVLAYGRVAHIQKSVTNLLARLTSSPHDFVRQLNASDQKVLASFTHRFNTGQDIYHVLLAIKHLLNECGSLEQAFLVGYDEQQPNIIPALACFRDKLMSYIEPRHRQSGVRYLLVDPQKGSPCKRLNLFLRWMVRSDEVDTGLWTQVDPAKLVVPMDVHMSRLCRLIGFHDKRQMSLDTALQVTMRFAEICPEDPVKYDFALSRVGILEQCKGEANPRCRACELKRVCRDTLRIGSINNLV